MGRKRRGIALFIVLIVILVLTMAAGAFILLSLNEVRIARQQNNSTRAFYIAEAGAEDAISELLVDMSYTGESGTVFGEGRYDVTVSRPDPDDHPRRRQIDSIGYIGSTDVTTPGIQTRHVRIIADFSGAFSFDYAVFGDIDVDLGGNGLTDSYDSDEGPYSEESSGEDGDVGSNGIAASTIRLVGNSVIKGDAIVGVGGDPEVAIDLQEEASVTGDKTAVTAAVDLPAVSIPSGLTEREGLHITNETVTLDGGIYWYSSLKITGQGRLELSADTTIYLSGGLEIAGNGIATSGDIPSNLTFMVASSETVKFSGQADFYGAVYAPESRIMVPGSGRMFGSIIGSTVDITGGGGVHYDEKLGRDEGAGGSIVDIVSWQELP